MRALVAAAMLTVGVVSIGWSQAAQNQAATRSHVGPVSPQAHPPNWTSIHA